jgi:uncharacterized membrane protein
VFECGLVVVCLAGVLGSCWEFDWGQFVEPFMVFIWLIAFPTVLLHLESSVYLLY